MSDPMTPAVPDPTVEALSEAEREAIRVCPDCGHDEDFHSNVGCVKGYDRSPVEPCGCGRQWSEVVPAAVERILAARAAAPDDLRDRLQALCDAAMRNKWHLGAEAVSLTVAQVLAVVGEGSECSCGHPSADHDDVGECMHLCDCAWPTAEKDARIAEVLAAHRLYGEDGDDVYECGCGATSPPEALEDDFGELLWHEAHVAAVLALLEADA